jgi:acid phosphatase type 7
VPNLVLTGHVHDYQRIEQKIAPDGPTPFIVCGNGGYHNLHTIHSQPGAAAPDTGAVLKYGQDKAWGFLTITIDNKTISAVSTEIDRNGNVKQGDSFSYPTAAVILQNPKSVPTL